MHTVLQLLSQALNLRILGNSTLTDTIPEVSLIDNSTNDIQTNSMTFTRSKLYREIVIKLNGRLDILTAREIIFKPRSIINHLTQLLETRTLRSLHRYREVQKVNRRTTKDLKVVIQVTLTKPAIQLVTSNHIQVRRIMIHYIPRHEQMRRRNCNIINILYRRINTLNAIKTNITKRSQVVRIFV